VLCTIHHFGHVKRQIGKADYTRNADGTEEGKVIDIEGTVI
jgi:hypothetical protein